MRHSDLSEVLLARLAVLPHRDPERIRLRNRVVELNLPLAVRLARKFYGRGEPREDLNQVAALALVKAVDRYDATRGTGFAWYAVPTITGELKRHFRDTGWVVRAPRRVQELRLRVTREINDLTVALGRSPTPAEVAARLQITPGDVLAGIAAGHAYRPLSLNMPLPGDDPGAELLDVIGDVDPGLEAVESRATALALLAELPDRERRIVALRFYGEQTQAKIAADVGISQMHVSRLLARSLSRLRETPAAYRTAGPSQIPRQRTAHDTGTAPPPPGQPARRA